MPKKKIILFDIDYTLFNGLLYRKNLWEELGKIFQPSDVEGFLIIAEEVYLSIRETFLYFKPSLYAQALGKRLSKPIDVKLVEAKTKEVAENGSAIYDEVLNVLEKLKKNQDIVIGIFSTGLQNLQESKIAAIQHHFNREHVYILKNKKDNLPEIVKKYKNGRLILVDDYWKILQEAKKLMKVYILFGSKEADIQKKWKFLKDFILMQLLLRLIKFYQ